MPWEERLTEIKLQGERKHLHEQKHDQIDSRKDPISIAKIKLGKQNRIDIKF